MLVYTNSGKRDFGKDPVECKKRGAWEFWVLLDGNINIETPEKDPAISAHTPTLWAFPPEREFGCRGTGMTERAIFDFSAIPSELEKHLGEKQYFGEQLEDADCQRIRILARSAMQSVTSPTQLVALRQKAILDELSLIALRSIESKPITPNEQARYKVDQVLGWFESRIEENPTLEDAARFVHVSVAHLRRMFHQTRGESPKHAFTRLRKERMEHLLCESHLTIDQISAEVGFASASSLNHFIQKHYGRGPKDLRQYLQQHHAGSI